MEFKAILRPFGFFEGGQLPPYIPDGDEVLVCLLEGEWYWLGEGGSYAEWEPPGVDPFS